MCYLFTHFADMLINNNYIYHRKIENERIEREKFEKLMQQERLEREKVEKKMEEERQVKNLKTDFSFLAKL